MIFLLKCVFFVPALCSKFTTLQQCKWMLLAAIFLSRRNLSGWWKLFNWNQYVQICLHGGKISLVITFQWIIWENRFPFYPPPEKNAASPFSFFHTKFKSSLTTIQSYSQNVGFNAGMNWKLLWIFCRAACRQRNSSRTSRTVASKTLIVAEGASVSDVSTYVLCPQTAAWDGRRVVSLVRGVAVTD